MKGWFWSMTLPKAHYFEDGRSLCGRIHAVLHRLTRYDRSDSPENCSACRKNYKIKLKQDRAAKSLVGSVVAAVEQQRGNP